MQHFRPVSQGLVPGFIQGKRRRLGLELYIHDLQQACSGVARGRCLAREAGQGPRVVRIEEPLGAVDEADFCLKEVVLRDRARIVKVLSVRLMRLQPRHFLLGHGHHLFRLEKVEVEVVNWRAVRFFTRPVSSLLLFKSSLLALYWETVLQKSKRVS